MHTQNTNIFHIPTGRWRENVIHDTIRGLIPGEENLVLEI